MHNNKPTKETHNEWNSNPNNFIWGFFYFNPEDNRLFPRKRIKELGWTINFYNPNAAFLFIFIIAIVLMIR